MTAVPPAAMPNFEGLSGRLLQEKIKQTNQEMRRVKNAGNDKDALAAISATLDALKGRARAEENIKEQITVKSKSAKLCSDTAEAQKIEAEVTSLKRQLQELTGEEYHRNKERRKKQKVEPLQEPPGPAEFPPYTPRDFFRFEIVHQSQKPGSRARVGRIYTPHGVIDTPCFVPVGTNGALKAVDSEQAAQVGVPLMFCNTYHLLVHPGADVIEKAGGLHKFMRRAAPIITDSGGFQVFSLAEQSSEDGPELKSKRKQRGENTGGSLLELSEEGTKFRSYYDGRLIVLTPESSVQAQKKYGSDIIIPLDELPPYHVTPERLRASVYLSHRWMARSLHEHLKDPRQQAMYGVVHGGVDRELRKLSAEYLASLPFDGFAIGGSLGKDRAEMMELLEYLMPLLPTDKPNHLLGIADEESPEQVVTYGVDTMDSCNPTRIARHGTLFTRAGLLRINKTEYVDDFGDIDPEVKTIAYSRAYLHHLFKQKEPLALTLATLHNMYFMNDLMRRIREKIMRDEL